MRPHPTPKAAFIDSDQTFDSTAATSVEAYQSDIILE
jgi:hypothetical protein